MTNPKATGTTPSNNAVTAYIAIGSNLDNPKQQVTSAVDALTQHPHVSVTGVSRWYESLPVGPEQPNYINGAVKIRTSLTPLQLLDAIQSIENAQGRERKEHWGARTLDLDIALFGEQTIQNERLCVPHAFIKERNFVIIPLLDITPTLQLPCGEHLTALANTLGDSGLTPIHI